MPIGEEWTTADVQNLTKWWTEGKTAGEIEALFGHTRTRNAIVGKIHRLKLPVRPQDAPYQRGLHFAPRARVDPPKDRRKASTSFVSSGAKLRIAAARTGQTQRKIAPPMAGNAKAKAIVLGNGPSMEEAPPMPLPAHAFKPLPGSEPVDLMGLTGCKWPVGDHPTMFCNMARAVKPRKLTSDPIQYEVYCPVHDRMSKPRADKRAVRT